MSIITNKRFSDANRVFKASVAQAIATTVYGQINPLSRYYGVSVVSTTGPNVKAHLRECQRVLGKGGKLYAVENDSEVFPMVKRNASRLRNGRVVPLQGDVFKLSTRVLRNVARRVWLDLDLCRTFSALKKEGLLLDLKRLRNHFHHFHQVWLTLTFTTRHGTDSVKEINRQILSVWPGLKVSCGPLRYGETKGAPMVTCLYTYEGKKQ